MLRQCVRLFLHDQLYLCPLLKRKKIPKAPRPLIDTVCSLWRCVQAEFILSVQIFSLYTTFHYILIFFLNTATNHSARAQIKDQRVLTLICISHLEKVDAQYLYNDMSMNISKFLYETLHLHGPSLLKVHKMIAPQLQLVTTFWYWCFHSEIIY